MKHVIFKFDLQLIDLQFVLLPYGAEILTVQLQDDAIRLWALVNRSAPLVRRRIELHGTGNPMMDGVRKYIGTVQLRGFVWHVFDGGEHQ